MNVLQVVNKWEEVDVCVCVCVCVHVRACVCVVCVCVRVYLWDHCPGCMSHQSEGQDHGLREELWTHIVGVGRALRLGGRECPLWSGRQDGLRLACMSEGRKFMYVCVCVCVSLNCMHWYGNRL